MRRADQQARYSIPVRARGRGHLGVTATTAIARTAGSAGLPRIMIAGSGAAS